MKKFFLAAVILTSFYSPSKACTWYDPDYEYFNLFTQSIIRDKSYLPFLHTYSTRFYEDGNKMLMVDDNIEAWQKYFGKKLNYKETEFLVNHMPMSDLNAYKNGGAGNQILSKLGIYYQNQEGIDYLIEAKYLEPFMRINYVESEDSFYYRENETKKNATSLDYQKTVNALTSLYTAAKSPEIKARYGYQLVRFNHYTRNYQKAIDAFKNYVEPLKIRTAPYYLALDQLAGAQRGLQQNNDANWNFFQVFMHSKARKENAFTSMKLSDSASFQNILQRTQNADEKNMAYFLLGYDDFTNPIPMMEKMYEINPDSEILKVMAARSINELERNYLPTYYSDQNENSDAIKNTTSTSGKNVQETEKKEGFWDKIVGFFKNLFSSEKEESPERSNNQSDSDLLENPNRIPVYTKNENYFLETKSHDFLNDFEKFTEKTKDKSKDEFWQIADAYLKFLKKDYEESSEILSQIKTTNPEYQEQITRMKMLNDIVSQPKIDAAFEEHIIKDYPDLFTEKKPDSAQSADGYEFITPSTADFIRDVLANRYFLQGEDGKSFLMNNKMSDLQYNPNSSLVKKVEDFYKKGNKTSFEKQVIAKNIDDVGNAVAFFNLIYGDREMRLANFGKAKSYYQKVTGFTGIPRSNYIWDENSQSMKPLVYGNGIYNGFENISDLVFGHNVWESFQSPKNISMKAEDTSSFPFVKKNMNKLELADALLKLQKIGSGNNPDAAKANQLIGNLLYNTSSLGYFREIFVMDVDNTNGGKYNFWTTGKETPYQYYYKNFLYQTFIEPDNFDFAINYYKKSLAQTTDREQKARILFQMASAEQGKYYQWEAKQNNSVSYDDPKWEEKQNSFQQNLDQEKNKKYRIYFSLMKAQYADTQTAKSLMGSCSYFDYFMKKQ